MKNLFLTVAAAIVFASATIFVACKGKTPNKPKEYVYDIYAAGYDNNGKRAIFWQNGKPTALTDGNREATAISVYVAGNDVYVVGYEKDEKEHFVPMLWKNGKPTVLTVKDGSENAAARSVYVVGNDVYIAGWDDKSAILWKNGEPTALTDDKNNTAVANSVFVDGADVYVAGYIVGSDNNEATLWKNGKPTLLSGNSPEANAKAVYVAGSDVYVAGYQKEGEKTVSQLWKNGNPQSESIRYIRTVIVRCWLRRIYGRIRRCKRQTESYTVEKRRTNLAYRW